MSNEALANKAVDTELWTYEKFFTTPPSPNQRNTIERAKRANGKYGHLQEPSPTHAIVDVARVGAKYFKLNGHTRSYLWAKGLLAVPSKKLTVNIIECKNKEHVCEIYDQYDSVISSKNTQDIIFGMLSKHGFTAKSDALKKPKVSSFFKFAFPTHERRHLEERLVILLPYLKQIDQRNWPKKNLSGPEFCAMLASLILYGSECFAFWSDYIEGNDYIAKGEQSAVTAFRSKFVSLKSIGMTTGTEGVKEVVKYAIPAVRHHMSGKKLKAGTAIKKLNERQYKELRMEVGGMLNMDEDQLDLLRA